MDSTPEAPVETHTELSAPKARGPIQSMFQDLIDLLTEPTYFFRERYPRMSLSYALTIGVVALWLGAALDWITRMIRHETLLDGLLRIREKLAILPFWKNLPEDIWAQAQDSAHLFPAWAAELFGIVLSPFQSLLRFCVSGFVLFLGAFLMISQKEHHDRIELGQFVKLSALTSTPYLISSILGFVPFGINQAIGWVYSVTLLLIGLHIRYRISYLRGVAILILPWIATVFAASCVLAVIFGLFVALGAALFGTT